MKTFKMRSQVPVMATKANKEVDLKGLSVKQLKKNKSKKKDKLTINEVVD